MSLGTDCGLAMASVLDGIFARCRAESYRHNHVRSDIPTAPSTLAALEQYLQLSQRDPQSPARLRLLRLPEFSSQAMIRSHFLLRFLKAIVTAAHQKTEREMRLTSDIVMAPHIIHPSTPIRDIMPPLQRLRQHARIPTRQPLPNQRHLQRVVRELTLHLVDVLHDKVGVNDGFGLEQEGRSGDAANGVEAA